jgi:hypothetical protein
MRSSPLMLPPPPFYAPSLGFGGALAGAWVVFEISLLPASVCPQLAAEKLRSPLWTLAVLNNVAIVN